MKLVRFMDAAYQGKASGRRLKTRCGDMIFSLEDLADQVGAKPSRASVEEFLPQDKSQLDLLISSDPGAKYGLLWGYLTSLAAERSDSPLNLPCRDYVGLEMERGTIILPEAGSHVGERMRGGKILLHGGAGDFLGQEMRGGWDYCGELPGLRLSKHVRGLWRCSGQCRQVRGPRQSGRTYSDKGKLRRESGMADAFGQPLRTGRRR